MILVDLLFAVLVYILAHFGLGVTVGWSLFIALIAFLFGVAIIYYSDGGDFDWDD